MAIENNFKEGLHRRLFERMNNLPNSSTAGMFALTDSKELTGRVLIVVNGTGAYLYDCKKDSYIQLPSFALAGTFGAGATGAVRKWSNTLTANGGTTTSITTAANINDYCIGEEIIFRTGTNAGLVRKVTGMLANAGGNATIYLDSALPSAVTTETFQVSSGTYFILNAGTIASGSFKSYDPLTGTLTTLTNTGLPASWGTDGRLVHTGSEEVFATGTATAGASTTLTNSAKNWTTNKWTNYQVRITAGTGVGQSPRRIASNTTTVLTVASAWTITPDATSEYVIEGDETAFYLFGNNANTAYKYVITNDSTGTWSTLTPTVTRVSGTGTGMSANWVQLTGNANYDDENTGRAGQEIVSFRGGGTSGVDIFNISGGTAGAGAWKSVVFPNVLETFNAGSSYSLRKDCVFARKDGTHRFFKYNVVSNTFDPFTINNFADGTGVVGDKLWIWNITDDTGNIKITYLYSWRNGGTELFRCII